MEISTFPIKVSAILPCRASAPDLRRSRLEKLLEKQDGMNHFFVNQRPIYCIVINYSD